MTFRKMLMHIGILIKVFLNNKKMPLILPLHYGNRFIIAVRLNRFQKENFTL